MMRNGAISGALWWAITILLTSATFLFLNYAFAACTGSSPTWNSTLDRASLATCVSNASNGDTINVAAGTETYTSAVVVNKPITILGAGITQSNINASSTIVFDITVNTGTARVSGFRLTGSPGSTGLHNAIVKIGGGGAEFDLVRIDNLHFDNITAEFGVFVGEWYELTRQPKILMHNLLWENTAGIGFSKVNGHPSSWKQADDYGTDNFVFIEDSVFTWTGIDFYSIVTDTEYAAKKVYRYNTITNGTFQDHDTGSTQGSKGHRLSEYYENTFICTGACIGTLNALNMRGGGYIIRDNEVDSNMGSSYVNIWRADEAGFLGQICDGTPLSVCDTPWLYHCSGAPFEACRYPGDACTSGTCVVPCASDAECEAGTNCIPNVDQVDGGSDPSGYPCRNQTGWGREFQDGEREEPSPAYWYDNVDDAQNPIFIDGIQSVTHFQQDRDYCYHDTTTDCGTKTAWVYTPYPYPHPARSTAPVVLTYPRAFRKAPTVYIAP